MIPWRVNIETECLPDEVCLKLLEITDTKVDPFWEASKKGDSSTESKKFGGEVNYANHTFLLIPEPYSLFANLRIRSIYQGHVKVGGGRCFITFWVRPSARGLLYTLFLVVLTTIACRQIVTHAWGSEWQRAAAILVIAWGIYVWRTVTAVKKAGVTFEALFGNGGRGNLARFQPLQ
jgi:hypothetical protein